MNDNRPKVTMFIQDSDSREWQFKHMNRREKLARGGKKQKRKKRVSDFFFVWNNDLWIKGKSTETEVGGCVMNSDKEKRKSFGLL